MQPLQHAYSHCNMHAAAAFVWYYYYYHHYKHNHALYSDVQRTSADNARAHTVTQTVHAFTSTVHCILCTHCCIHTLQIILWDSIDELQKESLGSNGKSSNGGKSNGFNPEQAALQLLSAHKRAVKVLKLCDTAILHISTLHLNSDSSSGKIVRFCSVFHDYT
jgi:hypothetical protein